MDLPERIEIYSAMPYAGGEDSKIDDWFHISRNEVGEHIEAVWDIETIFRPEVAQEAKVIKLMGIEAHFSEIRFHYTLNYTAWRYHEDLLIWACRALKPGGKLNIIVPDIDYILRYWLADSLNIDNFVVNSEIAEIEEENKQLRDENQKLREALNISKAPWYSINKKSRIEELLKQVGIPREQFEQLPHENIVTEIPDKIKKDMKYDWDFDLWLMQQLYSSGAGEPQDCFKAMFGKRYLSTLLRRTQFVITLLQNNPQNPKQIEAKMFKHPARLFQKQENVKIL